MKYLKIVQCQIEAKLVTKQRGRNSVAAWGDVLQNYLSAHDPMLDVYMYVLNYS